MQAMNDISDEQIAALEDELDALEERGEFLEQNRIQRIAAPDRGIDSIETLFDTLSYGNADIEGALDQLSRQLGFASSEAARWAGEEEARLSALAQNSVEAAREALGRRDLYAARLSLGIAIQQARAARRAAETSGPSALAP
jgi:chromosome segregation ATPase